MEFPKGGTATAEPASETGEAKIEALLSDDTTTTGDGVTEAERAAEDTSVADADAAAEAEETGGVEGEAEGDSGEESTESEEDAGESDFVPTEGDRDFSAEAYARAAEHYSKRAGRTLNPNDAGDRFLLRELMERGQKIRDLQAAPKEEEEAETDETKGAADDARATAPPPKPTIEQIRARVSECRAYAKSNIVPEVASEFMSGFLKAIWPDKDIKVTQEQANAFAETLSTFAVMQIADAIPSIMQAVPQAAFNGDPFMGRVRDMAMRETAIEEITGATDKGGAALFPDFEKLIENGSIKRMMHTPELEKAVFNKDPYKNFVAKAKIAYRMAKGQPVDNKAIEKAVATGRSAERDRAVRVAAGKLPPGSSRGTPAGAGQGGRFIDQLVQSSGSKFHAAVEASRKK